MHASDRAVDAIQLRDCPDPSQRTFDFAHASCTTRNEHFFRTRVQRELPFMCESTDERKARRTIGSIESHHHAREEPTDE